MVGSDVSVGFRPESVDVAAALLPGGVNVVPVQVAERTFAGDTVHLELDLGKRRLHARGDPFRDYEVGGRLNIHVPPERIYFLGTSAPVVDAA
jgi:hypothetical protein